MHIARSNLDNNKQYFAWIDVAKGLGLFFIFYGHILYEATIPEINQLIYAFHVPFFFILSGFVFSINSKTSFLDFITKKFARIIVPLTIFTFLSLFTALYIDHLEDKTLLMKWFFYYDGTYPYNMPSWFFITLFCVYLISYFIRLCEHKTWMKVILMLSFFTFGYLIYKQIAYIPADVNALYRFGIDKTIIVMGFFILGNILRDIHNKTNFSNHLEYVLPILPFMIAFWIVFGLGMNGKTSIYNRQLGYYWIFILSGICGSFTFLIISMYLTKVKPVKFVLCLWSKNTIIVANTHYMFRAARLWFYFISIRYAFAHTKTADILIPLYVIIMLTAYVPLGFVIDRYLPFVSGAPWYPYIVPMKEWSNYRSRTSKV